MSRRQHLRLLETVFWCRRSHQGLGQSQLRSVTTFLHHPPHETYRLHRQAIHHPSGGHCHRFNFSTTSQEFPQDDEFSTKRISTTHAIKVIDNQTERSKKTRQRGKHKTPTLDKIQSTVSPPQLLQLRDILPREVIEQYIEDIAQRTELTKIKLLIKLKNKLMSPKGNKTPEGSETVLSAWEIAQKFFESQKSLPSHVTTSFWNLIIAPTASGDLKMESIPLDSVSPKHIEILMKVREMAIRRPIFWNDKHKHRVLKQLEPDKKKQKSCIPEYQTKRNQQLNRIHQTKNAKQLKQEAKEMAHLLCSKLPPSHYKKLITTLNEFGTESNNTLSTEEGATSSHKKGKHRINDTYSLVIHACAKEHIHHVAKNLVDFLYLTIDLDFDDSSDTTTATAKMDVLSFDPKIDSKIDNWQDTRDKVVDAVQTIQSILVKEQEQKLERITESPSNSIANTSSEEDDLQEEEGAGATFWLSNGQEECEKEISDDEGGHEDEDDDDRVYDDSDESVTETFLEVAKLQPGEKEKKKITLKSRRYISFEALKIGDLPITLPSRRVPKETTESTSILPIEKLAPTDRLVFIDNLPVDISEEKLKDAYSRCGPIDKIQIFQQRPDLDPGRKSEDSKKKIRKSSSTRSWWERPRTPLYATILYHSENGARQATVDPLRIFGMVLDKHLIRSHCASSMNTLYLEDIPESHDITSIEANLSQILHPSLYVCVDIEQRRQRAFRGPSSCVIKFPDFESAHWAYSKLSADLIFLQESEDCKLHWMPTPKDAVLYWTRKLNF